MSSDKVTLYIDGTPITVPAGTNLIEAAHLVGKEIPHYCYHPHLSGSGNCRMCLVEVGEPDAIEADKVHWGDKPVIACGTLVAEGMQVQTQSEKVRRCREGVTEFLLANHPLDCSICDQAGECRLQEYASAHGRGYSRFQEEKDHKTKRVPIGPRVMLDAERCILCGRCIRFCEEVLKEKILGFTKQGSVTTLACFPGRDLDNNYSLNTVDICPVGALTSIDFRFKMRVWFLKKTQSICPESSVGVNTTVWSREGQIYRITPRRNDAVNRSWMSDSGREQYKAIYAENRLKSCRVDGAHTPLREALNKASAFLNKSSLAYVVSGAASVEEQFLLRCILEKFPGEAYLPSHEIAPGDGFLIDKDRTPNTRGAYLVGLVQQPPVHSLRSLVEKIDGNSLKTLIVWNEEVTGLGLPSEVLKKINVIYFGTHQNATADAARVCIPLHSVFEKSGTFVNRDGRLQKFTQAIPPLPGFTSDLYTLAQLLALATESQAMATTCDSLWIQIRARVPLFSSIYFDSIPDTGLLFSQHDRQDEAPK